MELIPPARDVIGQLRAVYFVLLLWDVNSVDFPLDGAIGAAIARHRALLEEMMAIICDVSRFVSAYAELRSAIDDFSTEPDGSYYTRDVTDMLLTLYAGGRDRMRVDYRPDRLISATKEILLGQLRSLIGGALWLRVRYYASYPSASIPPGPRENLLRFATIVHDLAPESADLPPPSNLISMCLDPWVGSAAAARQGTESDPRDPLGRVLQEITSSSV